MTEPCGKIRIPINESADDKSQIEEYLAAYHGEGIQHVALRTDDIFATVETGSSAQRHALPGRARHLLRAGRRRACRGMARTSSAAAQRSRILIDGAPRTHLLLQIFTRR